MEGDETMVDYSPAEIIEKEHERLLAIGYNIKEPPSGLVVAYGMVALSGAVVGSALTSLAWWLL
jgi:hypothetical protein